MTPRPRPETALTLIELLAVISVIAALASMLFASVARVRMAADRTVALQNMRTIGMAIVGYAADHDARLPGPLWPGQMPLFDPGRDGRLVKEVAAYLPITVPARPAVESLFVPPAYRRAVGEAALVDARTFVMNMVLPFEQGVLNPWGSLVAGQDPTTARLSAVPSGAWAFSDADRKHPRVKGASWANQTPSGPVHSPDRLAWFFDGSAGPMAAGTLE